MKIDARSIGELSRKQVRTRTSFHRQVARPFSHEKGALRVCEQLGRVDCRRPFGVRGRKKERKKGKVNMGTYCRGCHAPLARGWKLHAADWGRV